MLAFYLDTHIPKQVAIQLREHGIDVMRCEEVGNAEADDAAHLVYATEHQRILVTKDDDFLRLHRQWIEAGRTHHGIFFCPDRQKAAIGKIVTTCVEYDSLIQNDAGTVADDILNQVIFIP